MHLTGISHPGEARGRAANNVPVDGKGDLGAMNRSHLVEARRLRLFIASIDPVCSKKNVVLRDAAGKLGRVARALT